MYSSDKERGLYQKYFKKSPEDPNPFPDFNQPSERVDMESYHNEVAELRWSNFLALLEGIKQFSESKGIEYKQKGDMQKMKDFCFELTRRIAFY